MELCRLSNIICAKTSGINMKSKVVIVMTPDRTAVDGGMEAVLQSACR